MAAFISEIANPAKADLRVLRITTAGSVDDGKSTLIGRLLHDTRSIARDQLEQVERASRRRGHARTDLSLVTDGLRAEREQGITIDVAWRYFATARRRFVLSDTPGHVQFTRNMVTGCSTADVAVVLVDARVGLKEQSRRHLAVAALLGVETIVICVNKMDLVDFDVARFESVAAESRDAAERLGHARILVVPISALRGDNVVERSDATPFYEGPALLPLLESLDARATERSGAARLPVQWVIRPHRAGCEDYRGYAGRLSGGELSVGDSVRVLPSGEVARIVRLEHGGEDVSLVSVGESVIVHLDRDIDASRGDMLVRDDQPPPRITADLEADLVWLSNAPARVGGARYLLKHGTRTVRGTLDSVSWRLDMSTLERSPTTGLVTNDVARVHLTAKPSIVWDPYRSSRATGAFVLIDESNGDTVAGGMLR